MEANAQGMWEQTEKRIREAATALKLPSGIVDSLVTPDRELVVRVNIQGDDGATHSFVGFRVQHNNARGPYKGGIRYHQNVTLDETRALAALMSLKCSVANIPYGGAKGAMRLDPSRLSDREHEAATRQFAAQLAPIIGPMTDIPAPDVNTSSRTMAWMVDEISKITRQDFSAGFTGKPLQCWGSLGRDAATGRGLAIAAEHYAKVRGMKFEGMTAAVQGYGKVGRWGARDLRDRGVKVLAISDVSGGLISKEALDLDKIDRFLAENPGSFLKDYRSSSTSHITNDALLAADVNILAPCAMEDQLTAETAGSVRAKLVVEGANGPTTRDADRILEGKGITVIPDILANAGGVVVSYFEWVQNLQGYFWDEAEVNERLARIMTRALDGIIEQADTTKTSLRNAAFTLSLRRIVDAMEARGIVSRKAPRAESRGIAAAGQ